LTELGSLSYDLRVKGLKSLVIHPFFIGSSLVPSV